MIAVPHAGNKAIKTFEATATINPRGIAEASGHDAKHPSQSLELVNTVAVERRLFGLTTWSLLLERTAGLDVEQWRQIGVDTASLCSMLTAPMSS